MDARGPAHDHALMAKQALFNKGLGGGFAGGAGGLDFLDPRFSAGVAGAGSHRFSGSCTRRMRILAASGIFLFALSPDPGGDPVDEVAAMAVVLHHVRRLLLRRERVADGGTVYVITMFLDRIGPLKPVIQPVTYHDIGKLFFAFTVFYAYIAFSQYFLIWNANIPEETFWYVLREKGSWWSVGMLMIFGHFFLPFLLLLRIDTKMSLTVMVPLAVWAWVMHFCDLSFNIMPVLHPDGFVLHWLDLSLHGVDGWLDGDVVHQELQGPPGVPAKGSAHGRMPRHSFAGRQISRRFAMSNGSSCCTRATLNWVGIIGAFLVMAILVAALKHYTTVPTINFARAQERHKILAEARQKAVADLETAGWVDNNKEKGIVRLPNAVAMSLAVKQWQDPAKARAELLERAAKAFFVPPPPPEPKSAFE
jgi:hypothetical protein